MQGLTIAVDVQHVKYSEVKSLGNPMLPNLQAARLGETEGAGFGWKDTTTVKVGVQMHVSPGLMVRTGYSYGDQPIPESEMLLNILMPGVIGQHVSGGFSKAVGKKRGAARRRDARIVEQRDRPQPAGNRRPSADHPHREPVGLRGGVHDQVRQVDGLRLAAYCLLETAYCPAVQRPPMGRKLERVRVRLVARNPIGLHRVRVAATSCRCRRPPSA